MARHDSSLRLFQTELLLPEADELLRVTNLIYARLDERLVHALEYIGKELVAFLRSYTTEERPDDPRATWSLGPRKAHPGHWADVTKELRKGYRYAVITSGRYDHRLEITNTSPHAMWVERLEGYYVTRGLFTGRSPIVQQLRQVLRAVGAGRRLTTTSDPSGGTFIITPSTTRTTGP
jgi:hypothetical protein